MFLTEDIWFEILKELPVKTLGKCRCVCKTWRSLIVSPAFMAAHLKNYTQNEANSSLIIKEKCSEFPQYDEQYALYRDSTDANGRNNILEAYLTWVCPFTTRKMYCSELVGSIDGLLCLSGYGDFGGSFNIVIWNPMVRKHVNLPQSMTANNYIVRCTMGFGYHGRMNDYRVVKITYFDRSSPNRLIEVYSLKEREWRMVSTDYTVDKDTIHFFSSWQCFLNGTIHWLTRRELEGSISCVLGRWLLLFNVEEEEFDKMVLPDTLIDNAIIFNHQFCVFEYQSMLSISSCKKINEWLGNVRTCCEIWVQKEYNVGSSWCKVLCVELDNIMHINPVCYLGRNGKLFGFVKDKERVLYDSKIRREALGLCQNGITGVKAYTESLALLDQKTDVYTDDKPQFYVVAM